MKVLVTGASGFTGRHLAQKLFLSGSKVRILVRDKSRVELSEKYDPEVIQGDIRDAETAMHAVKGIDKIFHTAAVFRTAGIPDKVYWETHVTGTENLLQAAAKYNVQKFVHCSTVGVHGHIEKPPADEKYPVNPGDIYQLTKLKGEEKAHSFFKETGLPVTVIRPSAIYGPGDMRLLKLFKLASRKIMPIIGNGKFSYHMVYIDDLVDAFILAADKDNSTGESFIIGGEGVYTLDNLMDLIAGQLGIEPIKVHLPAKPFQLLGSLCEGICIPLGINPPIYRRRVDFFTKSRAFDISKSKAILNYTPKVPLSEGIARTASWYKKNELLS